MTKRTSSIQNKPVLAVIGGGRWGQEIISCLKNIPLSFERVVIVSKFNAKEIHEKLQTWQNLSSIRFSLVDSIKDLITQHQVNAAIIANSARHHFDAASQMIDHGAHVLIEKPIVLSTEHMQALIAKAEKNNIFIVPGLCYRFCSYLNNFSKIIKKNGVPTSFVIKWHDIINELRYGKLKQHDTTIDIAQDVMPHIWTILSIIFYASHIEIQSCFSDDTTDDDAKFNVSLNNITGQVILKRNTSCRERSILVELENNKSLKLDFTKEPGNIFGESDSFSADMTWSQKLSPLTQQLNYFFSFIQAGECSQKEVEACLNSVACAETASALLQKHKLFICDKAQSNHF